VRARFLGLSLLGPVLTLLTVGLAAPARAPGAAAAPVLRGDLLVFAAASLTDAFGELGRALQRTHPGLRITSNFAGSSLLRTQIAQGARADVFASADERTMAALHRAGRLARQVRVLAIPRRANVIATYPIAVVQDAPPRAGGAGVRGVRALPAGPADPRAVGLPAGAPLTCGAAGTSAPPEAPASTSRGGRGPLGLPAVLALVYLLLSLAALVAVSVPTLGRGLTAGSSAVTACWRPPWSSRWWSRRSWPGWPCSWRSAGAVSWVRPWASWAWRRRSPPRRW